MNLATKFECFEEREARKENDDHPVKQGVHEEEKNIVHRFTEDVLQRPFSLENEGKPNCYRGAQESKIRFQAGLICFKCKAEGHPARLCYK